MFFRHSILDMSKDPSQVLNGSGSLSVLLDEAESAKSTRPLDRCCRRFRPLNPADLRVYIGLQSIADVDPYGDV